ncbi:hypothetical protein QJS04_geneDACA003462 [Acorus gramineus]|uniref:Ribosomal protein L34Ae n=1 Tax=Acorus gramineus TaxID=55184 RepID=A0AAV9BNI8_ACOGR|nr:hypothetical protein QJS04_geneDACA003462 [Acorus gramineus]
MVDCRSLIEFCRAFEQHRNTTAAASKNPNQTHNSRRRSKSLNPLSHPFCSHSPFAAIDAVILLLVIGALGVLTFPYLTFLLQKAPHFLPFAFDLIEDVLYQAPVAYAIGLILAFVGVLLVYEIYNHNSRKCGNPYCKGLKKAVEFDIQLESEECVKYLPPVPRDVLGVKPLELGRDREELEAELKKMAPLNGRTVLIFRAPCGCPAGRMEVWGAKKVRRIKK